MMAKINVNGERAHPAWKFLRENSMQGGDIKWNFAKFLLDGEGRIVKSYTHRKNPEEILPDIEKLLAGPEKE